MRFFMVGQFDAAFRSGSEFVDSGVALVTKANVILILVVFMHTRIVLVRHVVANQVRVGQALNHTTRRFPDSNTSTSFEMGRAKYRFFPS